MFSMLEWKKSEVAVVTAVICFIAAISWYQVILGEMKTRDAQRKADVEMVSRGLNKYYLDYKVFPMEATSGGKMVACGYMGREVCEWDGGPVVDEDGVVYINKLPNDPYHMKGYRYVYKVNESRTAFRIYISLENRADKDYKKDLTQTCGNNVQCSWYVE